MPLPMAPSAPAEVESWSQALDLLRTDEQFRWATSGSATFVATADAAEMVLPFAPIELDVEYLEAVPSMEARHGARIDRFLLRVTPVGPRVKCSNTKERGDMYLRHIRAFIAVAEELHFGRAAKRLHIEQSPLSRTIRKLEADLGVTLLYRTPRGARLTWAGQVFLEDGRRVLLACDQAWARARAVASGYHGTLRIALSGDVGRTRLAALLALCRQEAPDVCIRLTEMPLTQLIQGLNADLFDAGLTVVGEVDGEIVGVPLWHDPFLVVVSARHPLLAYKEAPLQEVVSYPLVLCDPQLCDGCRQQCERLFRSVEALPLVAEYASSHSIMLTLVAAGYGVGFSSAAHLEGCGLTDVMARPLADQNASLTTYLLRPEGEIMEPLRQFIDRAKRVGSTQGGAQHPV